MSVEAIGWRDGRAERHANGRTEEPMDRRKDGQMDEQTSVGVAMQGRTNRRANELTNELIEGQMDG